MKDRLGTSLRITAIVLMGLTGAMNILGGVGTVCAAFLTQRFPSMAPLLEYQWLYQGVMVVTILTGLAGVWATVRLARGTPRAYRTALALLVVGSAFAAVQVVASLALRGKAVPANFKLYTNAFTLLVFLVLRVPGIWERVRLDSPGRGGGAGLAPGLAAMAAGLLVLTTSIWAGPSHSMGGTNWTHLLLSHLLVSGCLLIGTGVSWTVVQLLRKNRPVPVEAVGEIAC